MGKIILNNIEYGTGTPNSSNVDTTNLVKKDNIVTVIDENVTDEQIPSAKAVHTVIQNVNVSVPVNTYTKEEVDNLLNTKVDTDDLVDAYSKEEVDNLLDSKVNTDDLVDSYSKTEVDNLLDTKADSTDIIDAYDKTEIDGLLANKANTDDLDGKLDKTAIVTSVSSTSTDAQVPTAKAVHTAIQNVSGGVSTEQLEQAIQEAKTELENEITNIPKVTKTSELTNDSGFITANDIPEVDLEPYALKTQIPTILPASDVYDWAKAPTKPTYTASEVGALASNGTAVNASKVANALTISLNGVSQGAYNGSTVKNINITPASVGALPNVGAGGVNELGQYLDLHKGGGNADYDARISVDAHDQIILSDTHGSLIVNHEINNLKNTVVSGKTSVANAINGKLGTTLSNQTSFADMAYYIGTIKPFSFENLYVAGGYAPTPSGVGITRVIFKITSNTKGSSRDGGYKTIEFTNTVAQNTYRVTSVWTTHSGRRSVSNSEPTIINSTGATSEDLRFSGLDSDEASMIAIAVFDNPIYDVKSSISGNGNDFVCMP